MATKKNNNNKNKNSPNFTKILLSGLLGGALVLGANFATQEILNFSNDSSTSQSSNALTPPAIAGEADASKAFDRINPAVVYIITSENINDEDVPLAIGSGVIYTIKDDDAYIITNNHVVEEGDGLKVTLSDNTELEAEIVGTDVMTDLAVIRVDSKDVKATAEFGDSDKIKVGESVIAVGSPLAEDFASSVSQGIISAKDRVIDMGDGGTSSVYGGMRVMQTDAAINPGNSGGPLVNLSGQVIGINSLKLMSAGNGAAVEGMGFAIPSTIVVNIANKLISDGKVVRPSLGIELINLKDFDEADLDELKLPKSVDQGVVVLDTEKNSPAEKAGLKKNDVIVELDGKPVKTQAELRDILYSHKIDDDLKITYYRGESRKTVTVKLDKELKIDD